MMKNTLSHIGSIASLIGLFLTVYTTLPNSIFFQWVLIFVFILLLFVSIYTTRNHSQSIKKFKSEREIRDYMYHWIRNGGRVVIFTRDMSWVSDDEMRDMLRNKSKKDECTICLPRKIEKIKEFEELGATIIEYAELDYTPLSRFTIINYGRDDAKVAVGKSNGKGIHVIEEYGNGEHSYFQVANDLVNILKKS